MNLCGFEGWYFKFKLISAYLHSNIINRIVFEKRELFEVSKTKEGQKIKQK